MVLYPQPLGALIALTFECKFFAYRPRCLPTRTDLHGPIRLMWDALRLALAIRKYPVQKGCPIQQASAYVCKSLQGPVADRYNYSGLLKVVAV